MTNTINMAAYARMLSGLDPMLDQDEIQGESQPGGFNDVNTTGAQFQRIDDLSEVDKMMATNARGEAAQPGSPYCGNLRERLPNGVYFNMPFTPAAVASRPLTS